MNTDRSLARKFLFEHLKKEDSDYYGTKDYNRLESICAAWMNDESNSKSRYDIMKQFIPLKDLKKFKILDMASGCGTFIFYGLLNGYDVYGVEPEAWKHQFNFLKAEEKGYPKNWMERFAYGTGEYLPYKSNSFDVISTYQTLEHVASLEKCFAEFYRVLKEGGRLFIHCPDYSSCFEGHYQIPILPLMNKHSFKQLVALIKRPVRGIETINFITKSKCIKMLAGKYQIIDISMTNTKNALSNVLRIDSGPLARVILNIKKLFKVFRQESSINLIAIKK